MSLNLDLLDLDLSLGLAFDLNLDLDLDRDFDLDSGAAVANKMPKNESRRQPPTVFRDHCSADSGTGTGRGRIGTASGPSKSLREANRLAFRGCESLVLGTAALRGFWALKEVGCEGSTRLRSR
ncbi:hypothetical protein KEM52_000198 [Ascosphaera acerosa]|nr:hypothetical protein KEM52_000198 [Ascosphaera acerosa]